MENYPVTKAKNLPEVLTIHSDDQVILIDASDNRKLKRSNVINLGAIELGSSDYEFAIAMAVAL